MVRTRSRASARAGEALSGISPRSSMVASISRISAVKSLIRWATLASCCSSRLSGAIWFLVCRAVRSRMATSRMSGAVRTAPRDAASRLLAMSGACPMWKCGLSRARERASAVAASRRRTSSTLALGVRSRASACAPGEPQRSASRSMIFGNSRTAILLASTMGPPSAFSISPQRGENLIRRFRRGS